MNAAHLDYDTLADLAEGLLGDAEAASADAHLTGCTTCRDRAAELAEVSRVLAEAPAPAVPPELISRIDAALAAAATETAAAARSRRWRPVHLLGAAAAAAVVVVGGMALIQPLSDTAEAPSGAQRANEPSRSQADNQPEAAKPGVTSLGAGAFPVSRTGTDYNESNLTGELAGAPQLAQPRQPGHSTPPGSPGAAGRVPAEGGDVSQRLTDCVARIGDGRVPLWVDLARYEDAPATVIVFRGGSKGLDVWVTGPGCSKNSSDVIEHVEMSHSG